MFKQVELKYEFNALEPYIDTLTMETHYSKHHAGYTKNLNAALETANNTNDDIVDILSHLEKLPKDVQTAVRNNGGGYYNHNLYFASLAAHPKKVPSGELLDKINATFGNVDALKVQLTNAATKQFGSGWAWLSKNKNGDLKVTSSPNQDNPLMETNGEWTPILGIDVWEHAYYLKHRNLRGDYIKDFFEVLDWQVVEDNYNK